MLNNDGITATFSSAGDAATAAVGTGSYPIKATLSDPNGALGNYTVIETDATLTVSRTLLFVGANSVSRVYGAADPALRSRTRGWSTVKPLSVTANVSRVYGAVDPALQVSYSGFANSDGPSVLGGTLAVVDADPATSTAVGSYTGAITASGLTSANYAISYVAGNLTVTPASLTVTGSGTQVYGGSPTFSAGYSGFVLGQGPSVLGGTLAFSTTTTSSSHAGTYTGAVTATGLTSSNYAISFVAGNMVVSKATPTITWNTPAPIAYFTPLSGTQLDAAASWTVAGSLGTVAGTFTYTPAAGTVLTAGTKTLSATFAPTDSTDYTTATATVQIVVLGPGVTVIGSQLYCVGGSGTSNDQVTINPVGSSNTGSTGVQVQAQLNGVNTTTTYSQSFTSINILLQDGNDNVQMASTLTMNAVVTAGNGNDNIQLGQRQ